MPFTVRVSAPGTTVTSTYSVDTRLGSMPAMLFDVRPEATLTLLASATVVQDTPESVPAVSEPRLSDAEPDESAVALDVVAEPPGTV